jgi:uncharacterized protein
MGLIIILFCLGIFLLLFMGKEAFANRFLIEQLFFFDFPESFGSFTIFFISDIHRREISDQIINQAIGLADIVVIGGDLTEKGVPFHRVSKNVRKLKKIAPVFFVWGNNDHEVDHTSLETILSDNGVTILNNKAVSFKSSNGDFFHLIGIDDLGKKRDSLEKALLDVKEDGFQILLSHNPDIIKNLIPENNIKLVISGHTHGGQIRIFGYGPYKLGGIKKVGATTLFVSNGYGTTGIPLRLGAKAETHLITIKHGKESNNS